MRKRLRIEDTEIVRGQVFSMTGYGGRLEIRRFGVTMVIVGELGVPDQNTEGLPVFRAVGIQE